MKLTIALNLLVFGLASSSVSGFQQPTSTSTSTQRNTGVALSMATSNSNSSRRSFVSNGATAASAFMIGFGLSKPAFAGGLLDEFGSDPTKIVNKPKKVSREAVVAQSKEESDFREDMQDSAKDFEKSQKALVKAIGKKDQQKSSAALEELSSALLKYRTAGRLLGPDGGGDIPSVDEIRRAACRVQGRSFEEKVKSRDARLADAAAAQQ
ncbi:hypothetical protein FRACYDRAFT_247105 [Fragilariopsis cylindrus CCMP1102]|uniref:Uncharacterized protein n=1 Tax=Fragilariopsis cylindrus CCMP1102 TaxID=635003 RepID=A0A1E7EYE8_9STRA|nr:hypothetical protein FRACYDRAFT_247105 [Fragilariopsis cylindrus CCMP1102]|eukprot:OEU10563.1 hypothetical protein FRACYDRAFT_247105 [Fragilariopsis cylindrus CCMP1102]